MEQKELTAKFIERPQNFAWFLGAGTSRNSGLPTATDIIWDLKKRYYCQQEKQDITQQWFAKALAYTDLANLIFLDPDNGLEVRSTAYHKDKSPKFAFYQEVEQFWHRGQSLVIYQHKNMHETADKQICSRFEELYDRLKTKTVYAIYLPSYGGRIFFVMPQPKVSDSFKRTMKEFAREWRQVRLFDSTG